MSTLISSRLLNDPILINKRLDRWKLRLQNLTEIQLPTDYARPSTPKVIEDKKILRLPEATALAVLQFSLAVKPDSSISPVQTSTFTTSTNESFHEQPTPFTILLAAFVVLLNRYTSDEDITVGSSSDTRNPLVLRININPSDTFGQVVQKVQQVDREATADEVPFHLLISSLFPEKDQSPLSTSVHSPLFRVRFFNQTDMPENPLPQAISLATDLTVLIASHSSSSLRHALLPAIEIQILYNQLLFSEKRISHILDQLVAVLNYAVSHSETCIAEIPMLTDKCLEVLPDPKSDLKWSQFHGAITDIFSANAKKTPNNRCVVVSTGDVSKKRVYTYQCIDEASNIVAHYLINNGIEREDVVMIYAYRGVDLVVAIMGVLKAGATFSVIDNLNLKCEIPALEILNDGFLKGGNIDDHGDADILDMVRDNASKNVGVVIGPDSIGTLSFTSGSTGTPKGRHFSLTHYYPWMSREFGISDKDRFTMLSGIAHDPIQRDNCNRLQHLAPNASIINMYGTTETQRSVSYFLIPPLSSVPTFLESQKDIMPAGKGMQNVQLLVVNRHNKNLLCGVGEIGEIYVRAGGLAEGYLRLDEVTNEKFLKNWFNNNNEELEMSQSDDTQEWRRFWKGKRDRLYKTGDLGRYRPSGDVECVGRVDDQVKIRGFRIELGEIDTHLSQHPLVRENVTLVRRDKYEEQTLVCYFVPLQGGDLNEFLSSADESDVEEMMVEKRKYNRLIKQIKDYLKTKVPSYSVPSDKQALPFPDTAKFVSASVTAKSQKMSQSERAVHAIWAQLLPNPPTPFIPLDENFFDLGGHSILATRLIFELRKTSGVNIPLGLVYEKPTIREQANEIDIALKSELNIVDENVEIQPANNLVSKSVIGMEKSELNYANDIEILTPKYLLQEYTPIPENYQRKVFFVTGVTGFLGAFILSDLLNNNQEFKIIAHVRAETKQLGMERLKKSCKSHLVWRDEWESEGRLEVVCGDLEKERLGIEEEDWKSFSTSVLDTEHYVSLSGLIIEKNEGEGISEDDDLEGSRFGLKSGYGQSKWVAEKLIMEAKKRGLNACIVRPGYIVGDSKTGASDRGIFHITHPNNPSFRFNDLFNSLILYGYNVTKTEYIIWRNKLMEFTLQQQDNALYPLLHFVLDDLPTSTKAPELDDRNTREIVDQECMVIDEKLIGIYLGYLVKVEFLDKPVRNDKDKAGDLEGRILDLPDITAFE
ncbi:13037_t:CDS:2, partial [Racocetra fulgida]